MLRITYYIFSIIDTHKNLTQESGLVNRVALVHGKQLRSLLRSYATRWWV